MKKLFSFALAAVLITTLISGCGQNSGGSAPPTEASGQSAASKPAPVEESGVREPVTIEFWNSAEGAMATSMEYLVDEFNKGPGAEKGVTVNSVFQGSDVVEKLKTLHQARDYGNYPDVGQIYSAGIPIVLQMDPILPVEDVISSGQYETTIGKDDIVPIFSRAFSFGGKMIGMPLNSSTMLFYYNKDAAREAGLDAENPPTTIAELARWTEALTIRDGSNVTRYGLNIQIDRYELVNFLCGIGPDGVNYIGDNEGGRADTMTKLTIGEDGSLRKMLTEWQKVVDTGGFKPVNDNEREEFSVGMSAMNYQSSSQLKTMIGLAEGKFELGIAPLPRCTEEDAFGASVGGGSLCMFDSGDPARIQAAWDFVQFMASPESQLYLLQNNGYLPVNENAYTLPETEAFLKEQPLAQIAIDQMRISHPGMQEPFDLINWELNTLARDNTIAWTDGKISLDECHDNIVNGFNSKLEEYLRANS